MTDFNMRVGEIQIVALTDMNLVYPTPLNELWPGVPPAEWEKYRESFPDTSACPIFSARIVYSISNSSTVRRCHAP